MEPCRRRRRWAWMELAGQWTILGAGSAKKSSGKVHKANFAEPRWQPEVPLALLGMLCKTKYHSFSLTQIKSVSGRLSSAAPVTLSIVPILSH